MEGRKILFSGSIPLCIYTCIYPGGTTSGIFSNQFRYHGTIKIELDLISLGSGVKKKLDFRLKIQ